MKRVVIAVAVLALGARVIADKKTGSGRFDLLETTIPAVQRAIQNNIITADQLVEMYLARIAAYDAKTTTAHLNSYIHVNADAVHDAKKGNGGRAPGQQKGALWGIPMILKDNIDTQDMPTTAGSVAFEGSFPRSDAFVARKLRERRRDHPRQGDDDRVRELPDQWHARRLQLARRLRVQPVRSAARSAQSRSTRWCARSTTGVRRSRLADRVRGRGSRSPPTSPPSGSARRRPARSSAPARRTAWSASSRRSA